MEIKNNQVYLSREEEYATGLSSPVAVEQFSATDINKNLGKRELAIQEFEGYLHLPSGLETGAIDLQRRILERHRSVASNVIDLYMNHIGVDTESDYVGSPSVELGVARD